MNRSRSAQGAERLWIKPYEVEDLMQCELTKAGLMPSLENPVVNLESFVEFYLKIQFDPYAELDRATLGETEFRVGCPPRISINKDLTDVALDDPDSPPGWRGRWRATVAHEAGHVLLHRCLFNLSAQQGSLFQDTTPEPEPNRLQRCLKRDVSYGSRGGDWREIQANMGMAALLMPKDLFVAAFGLELDRLGVARIDRGSPQVAPTAARLARLFDVSKQAAGIRLETLALLAQPGQQNLLG